MRNILIIGWDQKDGDQIIDCLVKLVPEDMQHFAYKVYPQAPVDAVHKEPAPYIEIMDNDLDRARRIKDAIQKGIDCVEGAPDVQILPIEFYEGNGEIIDSDHR